MLRQDALAAIGLLDEQIPGSYGEDYDYLLRAARREPIVAVEQPLVDMFWHQQSFFAQSWQTIIDDLGYLLGKHPELTTDPRGKARVEGQAAFAQAALGHRAAACRASMRALRGNPLERRAYLALAVAAGVIPASSIVRLANRRGRGSRMAGAAGGLGNGRRGRGSGEWPARPEIWRRARPRSDE